MGKPVYVFDVSDRIQGPRIYRDIDFIGDVPAVTLGFHRLHDLW